MFYLWVECTILIKDNLLVDRSSELSQPQYRIVQLLIHSSRYVSKQWAQKSGMVYTNNLGQAIMQVDHWSTLAQGQARNSVRIESYAVYNKGLFILVRVKLLHLAQILILFLRT